MIEWAIVLLAVSSFIGSGDYVFAKHTGSRRGRAFRDFISFPLFLWGMVLLFMVKWWAVPVGFVGWSLGLAIMTMFWEGVVSPVFSPRLPIQTGEIVPQKPRRQVTPPKDAENPYIGPTLFVPQGKSTGRVGASHLPKDEQASTPPPYPPIWSMAHAFPAKSRDTSLSENENYWKLKLAGVDFQVAREAVAQVLKIGVQLAEGQNESLCVPPNLHDAIAAFLQSPTQNTAIAILKLAPSLLTIFEECKPGGLYRSGPLVSAQP